MSRLKIALVGTGGIAGHHVKPGANPDAVQFENDEAGYVAVVDVDGARAAAFATKFGIDGVYTDMDEMLAKVKPHIVDIATPPAFHTPLSIKAMEAGAWVMCEKPLCSSLKDLDAIQAAEARTGNYGSSVFQFRFGGATQHIKDVVEKQVAGRMMLGTCHTTWYRDHNYYAKDWRGTWKSELGGPTMGHGIHAMDTFLWTMGDWQEVRAMCATIDRDIEVEDTSSASVLFSNGAIGNILNSILCPQEETRIRYDMQNGSIWTEGASYELGNDKWHFKMLDSVDEETKKLFSTIPTDTPTVHGVQLKAMIEDFGAGRRPLVSGVEARRTIEFVTSLYKSAATGLPVVRGSIVPGDPFFEHVGGTMAMGN